MTTILPHLKFFVDPFLNNPYHKVQVGDEDGVAVIGVAVMGTGTGRKTGTRTGTETLTETQTLTGMWTGKQTGRGQGRRRGR